MSDEKTPTEQLNEDVRQSMLNAMYAQQDDDTPKEQPIQLRLAGKATIIPFAGQQIAIPRIEYVERLEAVVREQQKMIDDLAAKLKKMEINQNRIMNNANRNFGGLESQVKQLQNKRPWE